MMRALVSRLRAFLRNRSGVSAVEFAMISPILLLLLVTGLDTGRYVLATERVEEVANTVAQMIAQSEPAKTGAVDTGDAVLYQSDLEFFWDSAVFIYPDAAAIAQKLNVSWQNLLTVHMSSIKFVVNAPLCGMACTYKPEVVWSTGGYRPCGSTITQVSDTSAVSPGTLPKDVFGPGSIVAVDVSFTFTPTFAANYLPPIQINRSVYMAPRNVPVVETTTSALATLCPGVL
jgi:Flp pilus assembly pilin Flp